MICLSKTYLNHDILFEDNNMRIPVHPSNLKRGGICTYHKDFLPVKVNDVNYLKESLNFNLGVNGKQGNIALIHRSPSQ